MFVCLPVCLFVYLFVCLFVFVCLSVCLFACLFVCFVCLFACLSVCLFVCLCLFACLSRSLSSCGSLFHHHPKYYLLFMSQKERLYVVCIRKATRTDLFISVSCYNVTIIFGYHLLVSHVKSLLNKVWNDYNLNAIISSH